MSSTPENNEGSRPHWESALLFIIDKILCCESGSRLEQLLIAVFMAGTGIGLLLGLYPGRWMSPGIFRGFVAWLIMTICFAKVWNLFDCGGPIPTACNGAIFAVLFEL